MSRKARVYFAVAAAAVLVAAVLPASLITASAGASTTACGSSCTSPYNESDGSGEALTVSGSSVDMATASTTNSAQDWTPEQEGDVANAVAAGVLSAKLNMLYSTDQLVEFQYAPDGVPSDKCLANTASDVVGFDETGQWWVPTLTVVLAQCGITAQSLWILDASNEANGYVDLINAGWLSAYSYGNATAAASDSLTSPFAEAPVLTINSSGSVVLAPLSEIGGVVSASQMWSAWSAPVQSALRAKVANARASSG
jgi:hypothetical protein